MFNRFIVWLARSRLHRFVSKSIVVLEYIGRRSGKQFAVPVNYAIRVRDGHRRLWISSRRDRVWWRNFRGGNRAEIVLSGKRIPIELYSVTDKKEVADGIHEYLQAIPNAARYFGIGLDETGQPTFEDIQKVSADRVMVYADL
jgi:hypothetical protein